DAKRRANARFVVLGLDDCLRAAAERAKIKPFWEVEDAAAPTGKGLGPGGVLVLHDGRFAEAAALAKAGEARASKEGGAASFQWVEDAIALTKRADGDGLRADAIVTAPISKEAWALAGRGKYPGHTELLATRYQSKRAVMLFDSPGLRVALATIHIPLLSVSDTLTIGRVFDPIDLGNDALKALGVARPRIAVCGLNPHAGEGGLFGDEEERVIGPAIRLAQEAGIDARGPFPADTVFNKAVRGEFDLVVAMYHDQGLIPVKLLAWDTAVNVTLGLPSVRTSPDHGTAFDIAGKNKADAGSFSRAVELALRMVGERR
ncbi:MAG: 4-hydroxythreonine-4-phosphate dehydrogenase PdxA, partial [Phycisphaerales bacterium]